MTGACGRVLLSPLEFSVNFICLATDKPDDVMDVDDDWCLRVGGGVVAGEVGDWGGAGGKFDTF